MRVLGIENRISYVNSEKHATLDPCALAPLDYAAIHVKLEEARAASRGYIANMLHAFEETIAGSGE